MADHNHWGHLFATTENPPPFINTNTNTNTTAPSLSNFTYNEEYYNEPFYFPNMVQVQQPLIITDEYPGLLDQMLAPYCSTTTSTTTTTTSSSNNGIILNSNSTDFAGQSQHLPPKKRRQNEQNQQKQFFQAQTGGGRASAKKRKSQKVFHVTRDELSSLDSWSWRKYGQKFIKGTPYPRNYYRCSSNSCSARKRIERSNIEEDMLIITYTGEHSHFWPTHQNALAGTTRNNSLSKITA